MPKRFSDKTPKESKIYIVSFSKLLKNRSGTPTLSSVAWSSEPADLTFSGGSIVDNVAYITISGGSLGANDRTKEIKVFMLATLSNGEIIEKSFPLSLVRVKR